MTNREASITAQSDLRTAVLWLNGSAGPGTELVGEDLRAAALIIRDIREELESLPAPAGAPRSATAPRARAAAVGRASVGSGGVVPSQRFGDYEVVQIDCDEEGVPAPRYALGNNRVLIGLRVRSEADGLSPWCKAFGEKDVAACVAAYEGGYALSGALRRNEKGIDFKPGEGSST